MHAKVIHLNEYRKLLSCFLYQNAVLAFVSQLTDVFYLRTNINNVF